MPLNIKPFSICGGESTQMSRYKALFCLYLEAVFYSAICARGVITAPSPVHHAVKCRGAVIPPNI